ncbi:uncharacterized protein LOC135477906 [Liolophura sinensis]|uniref:uncharacterized protein LOC135477906 n=1 Tax=Liolophura sinensis TaxID=3198878 RepID=UPI0031595845
MKDSRRHKSTRKWFSGMRSCNTSKCVTISTAVCLCLSVLVTLLVAYNPYPCHASCKITWKFTNSCYPVLEAIKVQIRKWEGPANCKDGGQRCLYQLVRETNSSLIATHMTPVKHYMDDLTFSFTNSADNSECTVEGFSTSQIWYAVLDYGTNYCNLHNLVTGAGLDATPGYSEMTRDAQCTQYTSADCDRY